MNESRSSHTTICNGIVSGCLLAIKYTEVKFICKFKNVVKFCEDTKINVQ